MLLTLTRNIIVNTGKGGVPHKIGDKIEVPDNDGRALIANKQAEPFKAKLEK